MIQHLIRLTSKAVTLLILLFANSAFTVNAQTTLPITVDPITGNVGDEVTVAVRTTSDLSTITNPLFGIKLVFTYDSSLIFIYDSDDEGTILGQGTSDLGNPYFNLTRKYTRSFAKDTRFTGTGILLYLKVKIVGAGSNSTGVTLSVPDVSPNITVPNSNASINTLTGTGLQMSMGSFSGSPGSTINGSVNLTNIQNYGLRTFQIRIEYDASKMTLSNPTLGTGFTGLSRLSDSAGSGFLLYQGRFSTTSSGQGNLLNFQITLSSSTYQNEPLTFNATLTYLDDPNKPPVALTNGSVTSTSAPTNPQPSLSSINPTGGVRGTTVPVTINGSNFVTGATVQVSGSGVTVSTPSSISATSLTTSFTIASDADLGARTVTVTNPGPGGGPSTNTLTFTVTDPPSNPTPTISQINPNTGAQGATVPVTITGTNFVSGATVQVAGPAGVTASTPVFVNSTQLTTNLTIAADASTGNRSITVTNPGQGSVASNVVTFSVTAAQTNPKPSIESISPTSGVQNTVVPVAITGTGFVNGLTIQVSGEGVTVGTVTINSPTSLSTTFTIASNAASTVRTVKLTNPTPDGGQSDNSVNFTIVQATQNPVPTVTQISPGSSAQGTIANVTITGTNFLPNSSVEVSGTGIAVSNVVYVSATSLTARFTIASDATVAPRNVTVRNPSPGGGPSASSQGSTFTVLQPTVNPPPVLTSINPTSLTAGAANVPIILVGSGFVPQSSIIFSTENVFTVTTPIISPNQISVNVSVAAGTSAGPITVLVRNPTPGGGSSAPQTITITSSSTPEPRPTVTTSSVTTFTSTTAILGGNVSSGGTSTVTQRGVCYSEQNPPSETNGTCTNTTGTTGAFTINVSNLKPSTKYYVQAFATNTSGRSTGNVVEFTTSAAPVTIPTVTGISPNSGARGATVAVTITGTNFLTGAIVQAGDGITIANTTLLSSTSITANFTITSSATLGARPISVQNPAPGGGTSTTSATFTVTLPAPVINQTSWPSGTIIQKSRLPLFSWNAVTGATNYTVQVSSSSSFTAKATCNENCGDEINNTFFTMDNVTGTSVTSSQALAAGSSYYWRVRANGSGGSGQFSNAVAFDVVNAPSAPALVSPANGASFATGSSATLTWTPTSNTTTYELQTSNTVGFFVPNSVELITTTFTTAALAAGSAVEYFWRVRSKGPGGIGEWSDVRFYTRQAGTNLDAPGEMPTEYALEQNYPNPFNPSTNISFSLPETANVTLEVYNLQGQLVASLLNNVSKSAGRHNISFDASALSSGVYVYRITAGSFMSTKKMSLLK